MRSALARDIGRGYTVTDSGCWQWTRGVSTSGYGTIRVAERTTYAHRYSYELHVGQIPDGLQIDHLCRNRLCINPEHLEPVTPAENTRRRPDQSRSHCAQGHPMAGDHLSTRVDKDGRIKRHCRTCDTARRRIPGGYGPRRRASASMTPLTRRSGLRLPDARPVAAPIGEVEALLDDLAPACAGWWKGVECTAAAEWLVWAECSVGDPINLIRPHCSRHFADTCRGVIGHHSCLSSPRGHLIVTRTERIRSKPTK